MHWAWDVWKQLFEEQLSRLTAGKQAWRGTPRLGEGHPGSERGSLTQGPLPVAYPQHVTPAEAGFLGGDQTETGPESGCSPQRGGVCAGRRDAGELAVGGSSQAGLHGPHLSPPTGSRGTTAGSSGDALGKALASVRRGAWGVRRGARGVARQVTREAGP